MAVFGEKTEEFEELIEDLEGTIMQQKNFLAEIKKIYGASEGNEKFAFTRINELAAELGRLNERIPRIIDGIALPKEISGHFFGGPRILSEREKQFDELEKETLRRLKRESVIRKEKEIRKPIKENWYANFANKLFSNYSRKLAGGRTFEALQLDLERSNLMYLFPTYISIILFTTLLAAFFGIVLFVFFLFFSIQPHLPIIKPVEETGLRVLKLIWLLVAFPLAGFFISYVYPSMDRRANESLIDAELPFATINMAAISNSLVNPVKIFEIIISSGEFPNVQKEFVKLMNHINVHGYNLVNALRISAYSSPSKKMSELLSGLATTINSGGDLTKFFETRAGTLLFDYKINREKEAKTAETFMDLYISIVIAAPMIFMLLFMIMNLSGLGVSLPTSTITLIIIFGVAVINIFFLIFLHLKKTE